MLVKAVTKLPDPEGYSYAAVKTALAQVFFLERAAEAAGILEGRLKHLRAHGLQPKGRGSGHELVYAQADADRWLVALTLEEADLDPKLVVAIVKKAWPKTLARLFQMARADPLDPVMLVVPTALMSGKLKPLSKAFGPVAIDSFQKSNAQDFVDYLADNAVQAWVVNLTARVAAFDAALKSRNA